MKTALKRENDKFSAMTLKPLSGAIGLGSRPKTPKMWAIAHENSPKCENNKFLVMTLKPVSGLTGLLNCPQKPKTVGYSS